MTDRGTVDPTRQGGSSLAPEPDEAPPEAPPMRVRDAAALATGTGYRFGAHRAIEALADALARAIGCQHGDGIQCQRRTRKSCCRARLRACEEEPAT